MKILYVSGGDYAALDYDNSVSDADVDPAALWDEAHADGEFHSYDDEAAGRYFEFRALEFGEVDPKFIQFIKSCQDYDDSKHENFYVID